MRVSVVAAGAAMMLLAGCSGWMDGGSGAGTNTSTNPGAGGTGSAGALSGSSESGSLSTGPRGATMQEGPMDPATTPGTQSNTRSTPHRSAKPSTSTQY